MSTNMSEEQIHDHPDFVALQKLVEEVHSVFSVESEHGNGGKNVEAFIERVINNEVVAHMAGHQAVELGQRYLPGPLFNLGALGMIRIWLEGFLIGAKFQGMRDADLANIEVPDFFPFAADDGVSETPVARPVADPGQVEAVQNLSETERRDLFKSMLHKDKDVPPASE